MSIEWRVVSQGSLLLQYGSLFPKTALRWKELVLRDRFGQHFLFFIATYISLGCRTFVVLWCCILFLVVTYLKFIILISIQVRPPFWSCQIDNIQEAATWFAQFIEIVYANLENVVTSGRMRIDTIVLEYPSLGWQLNLLQKFNRAINSDPRLANTLNLLSVCLDFDVSLLILFLLLSWWSIQ